MARGADRRHQPRGRRRADRRCAWLRDNWYRDVWLILLSVVLFVAASSASDLGARIQANRIEQIRVACEQQNDRHRETLRTLQQITAQLPPAQRARALAQERFTVLFVSALAPYRDCRKAVRSARVGE